MGKSDAVSLVLPTARDDASPLSAPEERSRMLVSRIDRVRPTRMMRVTGLCLMRMRPEILLSS
jgi:hypothetical protein